MSKKGVGIMGLIAIILIVGIGIVFIFRGLEFFVGSSTTTSFEMSDWSRNKFILDFDVLFLENSFWVLSSDYTYQNGMNGGLNDEPWDKILEFVCWNCGRGAPSEDIIAEELLERVNDTYKEYFDNLTVEIDDYSPLEFTYDGKGLTFSYLANFSYSPDEDFYMRSTNVIVNKTSPLKYFLLYEKSKEFTEEEEINESIKDVISYTKVCTSDGSLSEEDTEWLVEDVLHDQEENIWQPGRWPGTGINIFLDLVDLSNYKCEKDPFFPFNHWIINFTYVLNVTSRDENERRMVPTEEGMERLGLNFGLNKSFSGLRIVDDLSSSALDSVCDTGWPSPDCNENGCYYWKNKGPADDCESIENCYIQKRQVCDCEPFYECENTNGCVLKAKLCGDACSDKGYDGHSCVNSMSPTCTGETCKYDVNQITKHNGLDVVCANEKKCYCYHEQSCFCDSYYGNFYSCDNYGCHGPTVVFFDNIDYNFNDPGLNLSFNSKIIIPDLVGENNDMISSLIVADGYKVILYENDMFGGDNIIFYGPEAVSDLDDHERSGGKWRNDASSIVIDSVNEPIVILYRASDYRGSNREFNQKDVEFYLDDYIKEEVSSIKIKDDFNLVIWNEEGDSHLIEDDVENLEDVEKLGGGNWNDKIARIKIISQ